MKNTMKKISLLFAVAIITVLFTMSASAKEIVDSGECGAEGDNVTWVLYDDGELVISGEGEIDFPFSNVDHNNKIHIRNVIINYGVTNVEGFHYCEKLESIIIPDSVTKIGVFAFEECINLKSISIPNGVTEIEAYAFRNCEKLESITIPDSVRKIDYQAFHWSGYYNNMNNWENGILYINNHLISAENLTATTYVVKNSVVSIAVDAFRGSEAESIILPDSLLYISDSAFAYCSNLKSIELPINLYHIGYQAFCGSAVEKVYISENVNYIGKQAFIGMQLTVNENNPNYSSDNYGILYNKDKSVLINYPINNASISFDIPETVKIIAEYSFGGCKNLKNINFNNNLVSIEKYAFSTCTNLDNIIIPPKVTTIGEGAFIYCGKLSNIVIPDTVTNIHGAAFAYCLNLSNIYYCGTQTQWSEITIGYSNECLLNATIHYNYTDDLPQPPTPPTKIKASTQTTKTITLTWNECEGATGYRVYKYNSSSKKYTLVKSIKTNKYKVSDLKAGTSYKFKIRPYTKLDDGTVLWGEDSDVFTTATKPATPTIKTISTTKGKAVVSWSNISGETGYQLYYSTKKDSGYKKVKNYSANTLKGSKSKLTSGKKYYFKVRAYKKVDGKVIYGSFSSVKSIKIK